jgi:hypothetical protein
MNEYIVGISSYYQRIANIEVLVQVVGDSMRSSCGSVEAVSIVLP